MHSLEANALPAGRISVASQDIVRGRNGSYIPRY